MKPVIIQISEEAHLVHSDCIKCFGSRGSAPDPLEVQFPTAIACGCIIVTHHSHKTHETHKTIAKQMWCRCVSVL